MNNKKNENIEETIENTVDQNSEEVNELENNNDQALEQLSSDSNIENALEDTKEEVVQEQTNEKLDEMNDLKTDSNQEIKTADDTFIEKDGQETHVEDVEKSIEDNNLLKAEDTTNPDSTPEESETEAYIEKDGTDTKVDDIEESVAENNLLKDDLNEEELDHVMDQDDSDIQEIEDDMLDATDLGDEQKLKDERDAQEVLVAPKKKIEKSRLVQYVLMGLGVIFILGLLGMFGLNRYEDYQIGKEADKLIHNLQVQQATTSAGDKKIEDGDVVKIDYSGSVNGKKFEGGTATDAKLEIGSKTFVDNFEEQLIGHKKGEKFDIKVTFPADYQSEELKGKEATFAITVKDVYKLPELTDQFVKSINIQGVETPAQLKDYAKTYIRQYYASQGQVQ